MFTTSAARARQTRPASLPAGVAAGLAIGGLILAVAGFSGGLVSVGSAGLAAVGLAAGCSGGVCSRVLVAFLLWATGTAMVGLSMALGEHGFSALMPAFFSVTMVALGQAIGLLGGAVLREPVDPIRGTPAPSASKVGGR